MRVLLVHNYYQQPGGEDRVFVDERDMLRAWRHDVVEFTQHNDSLGAAGGVSAALSAIWNNAAYHRVRTILRQSATAVMHCHNTFPLVSPSVFSAARAEGVAVIQTLHNYRLMCPAALLYREGRPCERCVGHAVAWHGIAHGCYRGSRAATAATSLANAIHRFAGTWTRQVDLYIAPSEFAKRKLVEGGLPADAIVVKPHFVHPDPGFGAADGGYALFVGRLAAGKGIETLLTAWQELGRTIPLCIVGDGPLAPVVAAAAAASPAIRWVGRRAPDEVSQLMGRASVLIFPSEFYETFGRTVIEAFACGTPVIASNIGAAGELVDDGRTGRLFTAGDPRSLVQQVVALLEHPAEMKLMRREARAEFASRYTMAENYELLRAIYERAARSSQSSARFARSVEPAVP